MIQLNAGNTLLKRSQRKQIMSWLRRAMKLGEQLGDFMMNINLSRSGRHFEVRAEVKDSAGGFTCRSRRHDWRNAIQDVMRAIVTHLHSQRVARFAM